MPFRAVADAVLDNLGIGNRTGFLEECSQLAGAQPSCELLDEYGSAVTLVFRGLAVLVVARGTTTSRSTIIVAAAVTAIAIFAARAVVIATR